MDNIIFDWAINNMESYKNYNGSENVVYKINFGLSGSDESLGVGYAGYVSGQIELAYDANTEFTPYENLTKEQVLSWVHSVIGEEKIAQYKQKVYEQIETQKNPPTAILQNPWDEV